MPRRLFAGGSGAGTGERFGLDISDEVIGAAAGTQK
jgi:hypothetical protein